MTILCIEGPLPAILPGWAAPFPGAAVSIPAPPAGSAHLAADFSTGLPKPGGIFYSDAGLTPAAPAIVTPSPTRRQPGQL